MNQQNFVTMLQDKFSQSNNHITIGGAFFNQTVIKNHPVSIALKSFNRHGLIAGATGTGKTKTLQMLSEQLSNQGVPVLLMDLKGDLSGLAAPGEASEGLLARQNQIGLTFEPTTYPVEFLTLSHQPGVKLRSTVTEIGPLLLAKMLDLNDTQSGILSIIFKYAEDNQLPLLDLEDLKTLLNYISSEGKEAIKQQYGVLSTASVGAIRRKLIELEQQGAKTFLGEPSFEVEDLMQLDANARGVISVIRLMDIQDKPKLFSSFMLSLLTELYQTLPEIGDPDKPKLVMFIDEAHLIFKDASTALLNKIENIVRLIRSKGVGLFFCTQSPTDVPEAVLGQLGAKFQHALRAFTAKDRKAIKLAAQNYPTSEYYQTESLLTNSGIGEAAVCVLDDKGRPTPLLHVMLRAPCSKMGVLSDDKIQAVIQNSRLVKKYLKTIERESAKEILTQRLSQKTRVSDDKLADKKHANHKKTKQDKSYLESLSKNTMVRQLGRTMVREVMRGLFALFGIKKKR